MISSLKPTMWKRWLSSNWIPIGIFVVLLIHGWVLGLTDDEAYYWVLAQRPDWGYAYHPPMIGWSIALSQLLFGWLFGTHSTLVVRLPAAFCSAGMVAVALRWLRGQGVEPEREARAAAVLLSLAGLFALGWMMVPDLPLFLAYTVLFARTWDACCELEFTPRDGKMLAVTAAALLLSKYSGILAIGSAGLCAILWAPRERKVPVVGWLIVGTALAAAPILAWNSKHEWASLLYQLRDRHGDANLSLLRYGRFWLAELVLAGPVLVYFTIRSLARAARKETPRAVQYVAIWIAPAFVVFCLQPLWADFKPHWAFVVWWPAAILLARETGLAAKWSRAVVAQIAFGLTLVGLVLLSCHVPLISSAIAAFSGKREPKLDVTNDLYGWSELPRWLDSLPDAQGLPIVGGRYQTAAQAAFSAGEGRAWTMLPRDLKARDEWPDIGVSEGTGPDWPKLTQPVLYVGDNRYDAPPEYPGAHCRKLGRRHVMRGGWLAKTLLLWRCDP